MLPKQDTEGPSLPGGCWAQVLGISHISCEFLHLMLLMILFQRVNNGELHVVSETSPQRPISLALDLGSSGNYCNK
jgi:hypothetical protein